MDEHAAEFLSDSWYLGAWSHEVGEIPLARRLLGRPIVFFRDTAGRAVALPDRCPHRFAYLSMGRVIDGAIQCGYHGLRFDATGRCVHSPYADTPPPGARLAPIAIVERQGFVWFWGGDASAADEASVPDMSFIFPGPTIDLVRMRETQHSHFMLGIENLLDPSHVPWLHAATLGAGNDIFRNARYYTLREGGTVSALWRFPSPDGTYADWNWLKATYHPPSTVVTSAGLDMMTGQSLPPGKFFYHLHVLTPETEDTAHYFAAEPFDTAQHDARFVEERAGLLIRDVFRAEDDPMMAGVWEQMGGRDFFSLKPALLPIDGAAVEARRAYDRLLAASSPDARVQSA